MFNRMKLGTKSFLSLMWASLFVIVVTLISYYSLSKIIDVVKDTENNHVPAMKYLSKLEFAITAIQRSERGLMIPEFFADSKEVDHQNKNLDKYWKLSEESFKKIDSLKMDDSISKKWVDFQETWSNWKKGHKKVMELLLQKDRDAAMSLSVGDARTALRKVEKGLSELIEINNKELVAASKDSDELSSSSVLIIFVALIIYLISNVIFIIIFYKNISKIINSLLSEAKNLTANAIEGKLNFRSNPEKINFEFRQILIDFNNTLDAITKPLNVASNYVDRISKGDIPPVVTDEYKGDFNIIINNLNTCINAIGILVDETGNIIDASRDGKLTVRANTNNSQGVYRKLLVGFNDALDALITPLNVAAEYVDRISKGDIPPVISDVYSGDFNELKNNLNTCIKAINSMVDDAKYLAKSAAEGNLSARADSKRHFGEFREIINGVNNTLDNVIEPIREAEQILSVMAAGDLTARMQGTYKGDNEKLKLNINTLGDSLSTLIMQVLDAVQQVASASAQISSTADTMASAAQEQSSQADEVASAVEEMSRTVTENALAAGRTSDVADKNKKVAKEGGTIVEQTVGKMRDIAGVVQKSANNIEKLGESSKEIGEIISVIDDIADQTNLLALNAAIEAARAGEQGRGFAVVADEVRKLAERTTDATKQIAGMIRSIQNDTLEAVNAMKRGNEEVTSGIAFADKAGKSLQEIVVSSQDVLDMINRIAAASEEQSATSEQIAKNVNAISIVTSESAKGVQEIARSSDDLAKLTEHLKDLIEQFKVAEPDKEYHTMRQLGSNLKDRYLPGKDGMKY